MASVIGIMSGKELAEDPSSVMEEAPALAPAGLNGSCSSGVSSVSNGSSRSSVFASLFASSTASASLQPPAFTDLIRAMGPPDWQEHRQYSPPQQPAMSATALLQKAAQIGAAASNASLLRGLGVVSSSSSSSPQENLQWGQKQVEPINASVAAGLGIELPCDGSSGLKELMMGTPEK
ncbi:hypothetical protein V6N11_071651 [Hibiscus sabdariffa]|uniref:Uncharacterized protein n=1 Tax=Hibiscus sabdariffa TaxID=183260 RepID=A0ABR2U0N5_9ROSI